MTNIIDSYISSQLGGLRRVEDGSRELWVNSKGLPVVIIVRTKLDNDVYILEDVYRSVANLFSMSTFDDIQNSLVNWLNKNMDANVDEVFTFAGEEGDYVY